MTQTLSELQSAIGGELDLSGLLGKAEQFGKLARQLQEAAVRDENAPARQRINACLMRLSRQLNPVFFTAVGPHGQDLRGAIPGPAVRYPLPTEPQFQPRYFPGLQRARSLTNAQQDVGHARRSTPRRCANATASAPDSERRSRRFVRHWRRWGSIQRGHVRERGRRAGERAVRLMW